MVKIGILLTCVVLLACSSAKEEDQCNEITSCGSCLSKKFCTWCVTKSRCTKQTCGNDNVIYPKTVNALLSGPDFCPRVIDVEKLTLKSGKRYKISVKITQIYLYMAFTPWKCRININGVNHVVIATLLGDTVLCESFEFKNESDKPTIEGSVTVLWDYNKPFDGILPVQVCRCDLDETCVACSEISNIQEMVKIGILLTCVVLLACSSAKEEDQCNEITSCGSCLSKKFCTWCVTKSRCTKQTCGNDNVIYPKTVNALLSGPDFCPRVIDVEKLTLKSGKRYKISEFQILQ